MNSRISVLILTFNEQLHIERCISSIKAITDKIYIVDSFSTDETVKLAESLGAKVYQRPWKNYADQFQWGLDNCPIDTEWVMRIDADEYLDSTMAASIPATLNNAPENISGFICKLRNVFLGRTIKFGGYDPLKLLRIWRFNRGRIESRWMDEHIVLSHGETRPMQGQIMHNNLNNHRWWTEKHNNYADREMIDIIIKRYQLTDADTQIQDTDNSSAKLKRFIKENIYNKLPLFTGPSMYFVFRYLLCLGFLDGKEGFAYHFSQAFWYRCLVDIRVLEAEQKIKLIPKNKENILNTLEKLTNIKVTP